MGRFASTVAFYEAGRPAYSRAFFETAAQDLGLTGSERLLDVGTGPGLLAIGFAPYCAEIIGVDPEPDMLAAAANAAESAGVALRLIEGRLEAVSDTIGVFDLVTIGRALHWLDPATARDALDRVVAPNGRILVSGARTVQDDRNPWLSAYNAVRARWSARDVGERYRGIVESFFAGSHWRPDRLIRVESTEETTIERLCDRVLSMSTSSPERLGLDVATMRQAMHEALAPFAEGGTIREIVEGLAQVFVRRGEA